MKRARDRGEYRPIFKALYDGPDYQRLGGIARAVLIAIKTNLPGWGIGVMPALAAQAEWWTGFPASDCAAAIEQLERARWIQRDGAVLWLVRGLEFEPSRVAADRKHRTALANHLATLPSVALLDAFRAHYAEWFPADEAAEPDPAEADQSATDDPAQPQRSPIVGATEGQDTTTDGPAEAHGTPPRPNPSPISQTAAPPPPRARGLRDQRARCEALIPAEYREELAGALRGSRNPDSLAGELCAIVDGMRGTPAPTWEHCGMALHDLAVNGERPTAVLLRTYARRARDGGATLRDPPAALPGGGTPGTPDVLDDWAERADRRARQQEAAHG